MVKVVKNLVNESKYSIKCPYSMQAEFVVMHNTANDAPAKNEIAYMIRNDNQVSFHYAVDDVEIVQGIPENRNAWHAGDGGNGNGNRKGIAIEICYSKSGGDRFIKAEKNAAEFVASILKARGWGIDRVKKHQDFANKYCPHRTLDMGWERFLNMVKSYMGTTPAKPVEPTTHKYKLGDDVIFSTCYTSSTAPNNEAIPVSKMKTNHGVITKIVEAKNPYLLNNGLCWVNDGDIRGYYSTKSLDAVVDAVIRGEYGNNPERAERLKAEGYDPNEIQALVNKRYGL